MITLVPYDPSWPAVFADEAGRLRTACEGNALHIDHVGSTSVPGLDAKPIIDIQITVANIAPLDEWIRRLEPLGYLHHPSGDDDCYPFFHRPAAWPHLFHLHLCETGSPIGIATLALRDFLIDHAEACRVYADEKRRLAAVHGGTTAVTREAYASAKTPLLQPLIASALAAGYPHRRMATVPPPIADSSA